MYEAVASYKDISWATVTNWETHGGELAGSCYAVRHSTQFHLVSWYRVGLATGNITSFCPDSDTLRRTATGRDRNLAMYRSVEQGHAK